MKAQNKSQKISRSSKTHKKASFYTPTSIGTQEVKSPKKFHNTSSSLKTDKTGLAQEPWNVRASDTLKALAALIGEYKREAAAQRAKKAAQEREEKLRLQEIKNKEAKALALAAEKKAAARKAALEKEALERAARKAALCKKQKELESQKTSKEYGRKVQWLTIILVAIAIAQAILIYGLWKKQMSYQLEDLLPAINPPIGSVTQPAEETKIVPMPADLPEPKEETLRGSARPADTTAAPSPRTDINIREMEEQKPFSQTTSHNNRSFEWNN